MGLPVGNFDYEKSVIDSWLIDNEEVEIDAWQGKPHIDEKLRFFPAGGRYIVVYRNSELFSWDNTIDQDEFFAEVRSNARWFFELGKNAYRDGVSFDGGFIGVGRDLHFFDGMQRVKGVVFYKEFRKSLLVSWRVIYVRDWSELKMFLWVLVSVLIGLPLGFPVGAVVEVLTLSRGLAVLAYLFVIFFTLGVTALGLGLRSLNKGNFFFDWLRENVNELHWDDIFIMEKALITCIYVAAQKFALKKLEFGSEPQSVFGRSQSRRTPRL